jgi:hypothetical protein
VKPVATDDKVWTTPRETGASLLQVNAPDFSQGGGQPGLKPQSEHFLFYRGIGHVESPLLAKSDEAGHLFVNAQSIGTDLDYAGAWEVKIDSNGTCAYRAFPSFVEYRFQHSLPPVARMDVFSKEDFSSGNLTKLKASMHDALVKQGLFPDEATAMLKTWEISYFKSPGLRFFYIVPKAWVDRVLPLKITGAPVQVKRVMVGRIELISDVQKAALVRLATGPAPDLQALKDAAYAAIEKGKFTKPQQEEFYRGDRPLTDLGIPLTAAVQDYLSLGRFRDALMVHEADSHPTPALAQFVKNAGFASQ